MSLPAEWGPGTPGILRECAYMAGLIADRHTDQLDFTTERKNHLQDSLSLNRLYIDIPI